MAVKVGLKFIELWGESMEDEVLKYEEEKVNEGEIVFYGPSNFTRWSSKFGMKPLREVLRGKSGKECVINRGFGSSCPEHQLYYYPRLIRPLKPKVLVYSPSGNSPAFGYSVEEAWELAQRVIAYAKTDFPDIKIYLLANGPRRDGYSISGAANARRFDSLMRSFCEETPGCSFIDMNGEEIFERKDIFVDDGVHFNQAGYDLYQEIFKKALKAELDEF